MYLFFKSLHIIAVISWMAGLLYLPRLFVYHAESDIGSEKSETFKIMERRLLKIIMNPAMMIAWALGLALAYLGSFGFSIWFLLKLILVLLLTIVHIFLGKWQREFASDQRLRSAKFYRFVNEVSTILMIFIVFLVIYKPF